MSIDWYTNVYNNLVNSRKNRGLNKKALKENGDNNYYEKHHIIPKCIGGTDDEDNLVLLNFREHVIAHELLNRIHPENKKLMKALTRMLTCEVDENGNKIKREIKSSREAEYIRKLYIQSLTGDGNPNFGKKGELSHNFGRIVSQSTKDKISKANKGKLVGEKNPMYGKFNGDHPASKKVIDGNGKIFNSLNECAKYHNLDRHTISKWIKNKPEKGYKFLDKD